MQPALPAAAMRMDHLDHRFTLSAVHIKSDRNRSEHDKSLQSLALVRVGALRFRVDRLRRLNPRDRWTPYAIGERPEAGDSEPMTFRLDLFGAGLLGIGERRDHTLDLR